MITETLQLIKQHTGLDLTLCDYFTGVQKSYHGDYFNVILTDPIFASREHTILERFADQYGLIQVEPNGYKRLAIFVPLDKATPELLAACPGAVDRLRIDNEEPF